MIGGLSQYNDTVLLVWGSRYKDKTVSRQYHLFNGNPLNWKDGLYIETWPRGLFYLHSSSEITAWIRNYIIIFCGM